MPDRIDILRRRQASVAAQIGRLPRFETGGPRWVALQRDWERLGSEIDRLEQLAAQARYLIKK
jgi:hypothetical protein